MDKFVARLGTAALAPGVIGVTPRVEAVAARWRAVIVGPICSRPSAAGRTEDDHVELAVQNPRHVILLDLAIQEVVGFASHVNVDIEEVQANAGLLAELGQRLCDGSPSGHAGEQVQDPERPVVLQRRHADRGDTGVTRGNVVLAGVLTGVRLPDATDVGGVFAQHGSHLLDARLPSHLWLRSRCCCFLRAGGSGRGRASRAFVADAREDAHAGFLCHVHVVTVEARRVTRFGAAVSFVWT